MSSLRPSRTSQRDRTVAELERPGQLLNGLDDPDGDSRVRDELPEEAADQGEIIELKEDELEPEAAPRRTAPEPGEPSREEVEEHRVDHFPYRVWCEHCVKGRGSGEQHRRGPAGSIPVVSADYLVVTKHGVFRRDEDVGETAVIMKILVVKDAYSKFIGAHVVPMKGVGPDRYAAEKLRRDILWLGYSRVIIKTDNEPAIVALLGETLKSLKVEVVDASHDHHPPYDSKSVGTVENAVRQVQGMLRTIKDCLEARIGERIPGDHPLMWWMTQHAAWVLTTRSRHPDGKTPYEFLRGKPFSKRMVGFGEVCLAKLNKAAVGGTEVPKLAARWTRAVFLGYERDTHEYVFHAQGRILRSRALQRVPTATRWSPQALQEVSATPHSAYQRPDPDTIFMKDPSIAVETERQSAKQMRDLNLRRQDFVEHGLTNVGCPRCAWVLRYGWELTSTLSHSSECRERLKAAIRASGDAGRMRVEALEQRHARARPAPAGEAPGPEASAAPAEGERTDAAAGAAVGESAMEQGHQEDAVVPEFERFSNHEEFDPWGSRKPPGPGAGDIPTDPASHGADEDMGQSLGAITTARSHEWRSASGLGVSALMKRTSLGGHRDDYSRGATANAKRFKDSVATGGPQLETQQAEASSDTRRDMDFLMKLAYDLGADPVAVSEMYSPPRGSEAAGRLKHLSIAPGFSLDLTTLDERGVPWDFSLAERRQAARAKLNKEKPMFLVGSPPRTRFCSWHALNDKKRDPRVVEQEHVAAMVHIEFMCELYRAQIDAGRYFLHGHPATAASWREEPIEDILAHEDVECVVGNRCQYGQEDGEGNPVKTPTKFLSNSSEVLKALSKKCHGREGRCKRPGGGTHVKAQGSVTAGTAIYSFGLCKAILVGFRNQLRVDGRLVLGIVGVQRPEETMSDVDLMRIYRAQGNEVELDSAEQDEVFTDAITGQRLNAELVRAARREELEYFAAKNVYKKVPRRKAMELQGKPPITVKWLDTNKGDDDEPNYRSSSSLVKSVSRGDRASSLRRPRWRRSGASPRWPPPTSLQGPSTCAIGARRDARKCP